MADHGKGQEQHKEEPIIIKKKKGHGGHGHHGGAWKVAYADFVTAMMAFFIVMWILASSEEVKEQVSAYFNDPGAFNFVTGERTIPIDLDLQSPKKGGKDEKSNKGKFEISFSPEMRDSVVSKLEQKALLDSIEAANMIAKKGEEINAFLNKMAQENPNLEEILSSIKIEMTNEGLRIELIESSESLFFEIGSSNLKAKAIDILSTLAKEIGKLNNNVEIEGHTDSRGYKGKNYSNWELSSDRAHSARKILETNGMWEGQIVRVTGFADHQLRNPENPFDVTNRRVSILVKHLDSKYFLPTAEEE